MMSIAARVMRNLLVDRARARRALSNGGALRQVDLNEALIRTDEDADVILAVAEAMRRLARTRPRGPARRTPLFLRLYRNRDRCHRGPL